MKKKKKKKLILIFNSIHSYLIALIDNSTFAYLTVSTHYPFINWCLFGFIGLFIVSNRRSFSSVSGDNARAQEITPTNSGVEITAKGESARDGNDKI